MAEYIEREAVNALIKAECSPKVAAYLIDAVATIPAADTAEELTRRLEQFQYMPPPAWIPVTERLPKEGEFVLVYGDLYPNRHDGGVIAVSKRMDWNYWQGFGRERDITHWMPLPTPPTAEEDE